jgi:hypothetical protein
MKFRIHFTLTDGTDDSVVIDGDTIPEVQMKATQAVESRGGTDPWSEELT